MAKRDLDKHFPRNGACWCHKTRYARHRIVDAIRARHKLAGYSIAELMRDYGLSRAAVKAAVRSTPDDNRMTAKEMKDDAT